MKSAVAVALIICGVVLIGLPPVADFLWQLAVARLIEVRSGNAAFMGHRDEFYRGMCFTAGAVMIVVAVWASLRHRDVG